MVHVTLFAKELTLVQNDRNEPNLVNFVFPLIKIRITFFLIYNINFNLFNTYIIHIDP